MRPTANSHLLAILVPVFLLSVPAAADQGPWGRTEVRDDCLDFDPLRQPYFGDTHVHTNLSMDAVVNGTANGPSDAYDFAKGAPLPYTAGNAVATAQLNRPLDYAVVTDHSEFFGETSICLDPSQEPGYSSGQCVNLRDDIGQQFDGPLDSQSFLDFYFPSNTPETPRFSWCGTDDVDCLARASIIWDSIQTDAETHYDRSDACSFTTFVGYEWTSNTGFRNLHRNVIFRNEIVTPLPVSYFEEWHDHNMRAALLAQCQEAGTGCDALAIPHNSNIGGGWMFVPETENFVPYTAADAALRAMMEPIVEVNQHKADSECHPVLSNDELCGFEKTDITSQLPLPGLEPKNFIRDALLVGLQEKRRVGVNPMPMGMISATDGHMAMSGLVREDTYYGHVGSFDETPEQQMQDTSLFHAATNPGGLGVFWAEENSRDALFAAMQRREVYSTTGTRPLVRFFAGRLPNDICGGGDFVREGYVHGVPMGGELGRRGPTFAVLAAKDPGPPGLPGNDIQRVQIIKGWVDKQGNKHEKTYDIGGDPNNGATVDTATCTPVGSGFSEICATWKDPDFDKDEEAFYYARVVENPSCRWSQYLCNREGVDCNGVVPPEFTLCCDGSVPSTIQERAVTSPIWYRPDQFSNMRVKILYQGVAPGDEELLLSAKIARASADLDPDVNDLTLEIRDDDVIYSVTIPAGTLVKRGTTYLWKDPLGTLGGIKRMKLKRKSNGGVILTLRTVPMAFPALDAGEHMVHLRLASGHMDLEHRRIWVETNGGKALGTSR